MKDENSVPILHQLSGAKRLGVESLTQFLLLWTESTAFKAYVKFKIPTALPSKAYIRNSVVSAQGRGWNWMIFKISFNSNNSIIL